VNSAPLRAVVDASVAVKIFVPEALSDRALAVFERYAVEDDAELIVPDFFYIECANVFWKWVQRSAYPEEDAHGHLRDLAALHLTAIPAQLLCEHALEIALAHRITAYDACYLAAAAQLELPLITADEKLVQKIAKASYDVRWLGDVAVAAE
jgi:predicted nucleic acid-binding protein